MNKNFLYPVIYFVCGLVAGFGAKTLMSSTKISSENDKINYSLGLEFGKTLREHNIPVNNLALAQGVSDAAEQRERFTGGELQEMRMLTSNKLNQKATDEFKENKQAGDAFLLKNQKDKKVQILPSGVQIETLSGGGGKTPSLSSFVTIKMVGKLIDGTVFENRKDNPITLPVKDLLQGLQEGILRMKEGGSYVVYIPSELGTAAQRTKIIKPGAVLIYEVELIRLTN